MNSLFQLRPDATIDQVTGYLVVLNHQFKAVQDSLFEMTCCKTMLLSGESAEAIQQNVLDYVRAFYPRRQWVLENITVVGVGK